MNDQTVTFNDGFMQMIANLPFFTAKQFTVWADTVTSALKKTLRGLYVICDNGYSRLRMYQFPLKYASTDAECVFSSRLESVRKGMLACCDTHP
jgi:hypothetical protein